MLLLLLASFFFPPPFLPVLLTPRSCSCRFTGQVLSWDPHLHSAWGAVQLVSKCCWMASLYVAPHTLEAPLVLGTSTAGGPSATILSYPAQTWFSVRSLLCAPNPRSPGSSWAAVTSQLGWTFFGAWAARFSLLQPGSKVIQASVAAQAG